MPTPGSHTQDTQCWYRTFPGTPEKTGERWVATLDIEKRHPNAKPEINHLTHDRPHIFQSYKESKRAAPSLPLTHVQLSDGLGVPRPDFDRLLDKVRSIPSGHSSASEYHHAVEALLTALFYPALSDPKKEDPIHEGRKRLDISYTNTASQGFFHWLVGHAVPARYVVVECKNYGRDVENPELDQLSSRFSPLRGMVGILACRGFNNKDLFLKRCRDTALDHRGYVIALDDVDLSELVEEVRQELDPEHPRLPGFGLLKQRFDALVS